MRIRDLELCLVFVLGFGGSREGGRRTRRILEGTFGKDWIFSTLVLDYLAISLN